jgi:hypothetical protein
MSTYNIVLFLHMVSAIALFVGYGYEWMATALLRRAATAEQVRAWLRVFRVSPPLSGAALLSLIFSGGFLGSAIKVMAQRWMMASFAGIVIALIIGFGVILPRVKAVRSALPGANESLSAEALARLQNSVLSAAVRTRVLLAVGIVFLMTVKPDSAISTGILGAFVGLGIIASIPAFLKSRHL